MKKVVASGRAVRGVLLMCLAGALMPVTAVAQSEPAEAQSGPMETQVSDPFEGVNRKIFVFNEKLDEYVLRPVAQGYRKVTPDFLDRGITNIFRNLDDVIVLANSLLQLKGHDSANTLSRILFNTTFGIGGFFDVATEFGLPKNDEDFGQTLGYWGVGSGPYLMLPLLGPSTTRDAGGKFVDVYADPIHYWLSGTESLVAAGVEGVDKRADLIPAESLIIGDRYLFIRNAYLQRRAYLVQDGKVEDPFASDDFDEDFEF